jgi:hypothetical protein
MTKIIATAKAQVEAAKEEEEEAVAKVEELEAKATSRSKRALEEAEGEEGSVKRVRIGDIERQAWIDARRGRALLGLAIGLGARYAFSHSLLMTVLYYHIWFNGSTGSGAFCFRDGVKLCSVEYYNLFLFCRQSRVCFPAR